MTSPSAKVEAWSGEAAPPAKPIAWIQLVDNDNNVYYYNTETGESSWEKPTEMTLDAPYGLATASAEVCPAGGYATHHS